MKYLYMLLIVVLSTACKTRHIVVVSSSVVGLNLSPGNTASNPQVTFAYKRSEYALVPTAVKNCDENNDCFSTLTALGFNSRISKGGRLMDFMATGFAARELTKNVSFDTALTNANH